MNAINATKKVFEKNRFKSYGVTLSALAPLLFAFFLLSPAVTNASVVYSENFDSLGNGVLTTLDTTWTGSSNIDVTSSNSLSPTKSIYNNGDTGTVSRKINIPLGTTQIQASAWIYITETPLVFSAIYSFIEITTNGGSSGSPCEIRIQDTDNQFGLYSSAESPSFTGIGVYATSSRWYNVILQYDQTLGCKAIVNGISSDYLLPETITYALSATSTIEIDVDNNADIDNLHYDNIEISTTLDSSYSSTASPTNTRIVNTQPRNDGYVYALGEIDYASTTWYINSNDGCSSLLCQTRFQYNLSYIDSAGDLGPNVWQYDTELNNFDAFRSGLFPISEYLTEQGTYTVQITIYNDVLGPINRDLAIYSTNFIIATRTIPSAATLLAQKNENMLDQAFGSISCTFSFPFIGLDDIKCLGQYLLAIFVPSSDVLTTEIKKSLSNLIYAPPWGYIMVLNDSLLNPATTATSSTQLSFTPQAGMPGYGTSLTLDVADGVSLFESTLSGTSTSFVGSYFEQFSFYWELLWYLAFALWLLWNLLGLAAPSEYSMKQEERTTRLNNKHTLRVGQSKGTLDLRK